MIKPKQKKNEKGQRYSKWLKKLARPKKYFVPPRHPRFAVTIYGVSIAAMRLKKPTARVRTLAKPKKYLKHKIHKGKTTNYGISIQALKYKISARIKKLARPKPPRKKKWKPGLKLNYGINLCAFRYLTSKRIVKFTEPKTFGELDDALFKVKPSALKYKATPRMIKLAHHRFHTPFHDVKRSKYSGIPISLLKSKLECSKRLLSLAKAKKYRNLRIRYKLTKFGVSLFALDYKTTNRTSLLAKPKQDRQKMLRAAAKVNAALSIYGVKLKALKADASNRTKSLAKPKKYVSLKPRRDQTIYGVVKSALEYTASQKITSLAKPKYVNPKFIAKEVFSYI